MKTFTVLLLTFLISLIPADTQAQEEGVPSKKSVLKAIETFIKSPTSTEGKSAAATIAVFTEKSESVMVMLSPKVLPWLESVEKPPFSDTLLAAYFAGNIKAQLDRGDSENDSYAGIQQVLKTYAQLKKTNKTLRIPELERFVELDEKKRLKKYLEDVLQPDSKPAYEQA